MRPSQGSILAIVLSIVAALYLLAGMMFIINRQYFSDIHMAQKSSNHRRTLLDAGLSFINERQSSGLYVDNGILTWDDCDLLHHPEYQMHDDHKVLYQSAKLARDCHQHSSHRLWLSGLENVEDHLVMDHITLIDNWQDSIHQDGQLMDVISKENAWWLMLENGVLQKEILLIESEFLPVLAHKSMRIHRDHYELVLVFENRVNQELLLYHLWIPIAELHFDVSMMFEFRLNQYSAYDHSDIVTMNINDARNPNWRMIIHQKKLDVMLIKNNVIFAVLDSKDQTRQSIIGIYLKGQPFFSERLVGFEYVTTDEVIELIPCLYRQPLIVAGQWQIGCDVQQKIRYYFPE